MSDPVEHQPLLQSSIAIGIPSPLPTSTVAPEIQTASSSHRGACCSSGSCSPLARHSNKCIEPEAIGTCRICFESETSDSQDPANPLICPCLCSGSSKYVHRQCLEQWRNTNHRQDAAYQCEVCKYRYQYRRLWWANLLGSPATLAVLFVLIMTACIFALGFVPVLNSWGSSSSSSGGSSAASAAAATRLGRILLHLANGVVMLGILGLACSLVLLVARACGVNGLVLLPDPCCPGCVFCLDSGGSGLGWLPLECASAGECGIIIFGVAAVVLVVVGIVMACYLVYGLLWMLVHLALGRAQQMVENVQQNAQQNAQQDAQPSLQQK